MRRAGLLLLVALALVLGAPGLVGAAKTPATDSATGTGNTATFTNINFSVSSGALGEDPTGHSESDVAGQHLVSTSITCVSVVGNSVTYAGTLAPNAFGLTYFLVTATDNGPADSGLDTFGGVGSVTPQSCAVPVATQEPLTSGDIVVSDCVDAKDKDDPTKSKCKDKV